MKGHAPRLKETEQEKSLCPWTAHLLSLYPSYLPFPKALYQSSSHVGNARTYATKETGVTRTLHKAPSKPNVEYSCGFTFSSKGLKGMGSLGNNGRQKGKKEVSPEALLGGKALEFYNLPKHVAKTPLPWEGMNVLWGRV